MSRLSWRSFGVTKPMALWRCSSLYQATNRSTHAHAASIDSNGYPLHDPRPSDCDRIGACSRA
jgi:hypothetical protein